MTSQLDDISRAIGRLEAGVENLVDSHKEGRNIQDRRHEENKIALNKIEKRLQPLEIARWRISGAIAFGALILGCIGWAASLIAGKLVSWGASLIR